jgi:hypothetical protein
MIRRMWAAWVEAWRCRAFARRLASERRRRMPIDQACAQLRDAYVRLGNRNLDAELRKLLDD